MRTRKSMPMLKLGSYSFGTGDRFGHQGRAQLHAVQRAAELGTELVPVWNKSFREHQIIGTQPESVRLEADRAIRDAGYTGAYFVDADHITMETVEAFIPWSDFFTLDVARFIGRKPDQIPGDLVEALTGLPRIIRLAHGKSQLEIHPGQIHAFLDTYYLAVEQAAVLFRHISSQKGAGRFIAEMSMDEVPVPQSPTDLMLMLFALSWFGVEIQTIAPRFSGRFNKGVDYQGDIEVFRREFEADLLVLRYAVEHFGMPDNLKLSIHSGSDKFSIYPVMGDLIRQYDAGIHVKTAGTTWLEEVIGLCLSDREGVTFVQNLYLEARARLTELCAPYSDVIWIDPEQLPERLCGYSGPEIADMLRHDPVHPAYNQHMRQLMHVGYKLAAENLEAFENLLQRHHEVIARQVEDNIFERHIRRLFDPQQTP